MSTGNTISWLVESQSENQRVGEGSTCVTGNVGNRLVRNMGDGKFNRLPNEREEEPTIWRTGRMVPIGRR
jgi:hypothetical protein